MYCQTRQLVECMHLGLNGYKETRRCKHTLALSWQFHPTFCDLVCQLGPLSPAIISSVLPFALVLLLLSHASLYSILGMSRRRASWTRLTTDLLPCITSILYTKTFALTVLTRTRFFLNHPFHATSYPL